MQHVERERLLRLTRLTGTAIEVLGDRDRAVHWLTRSNRALGGETPVELVQTEEGLQSALDALYRIEHGVFS